MRPAEKAPRTLRHDDDNVLKRCPVWRFADHDVAWPPSYPSLGDDGFREALAKLASFETQTIGELWAPNTNHHVYDASEMPQAARQRLEALQRDDETSIWCLRLQGEFRIMGVLREHIFYVLWIDPKHEVWPTYKKHT